MNFKQIVIILATSVFALPLLAGMLYLAGPENRVIEIEVPDLPFIK